MQQRGSGSAATSFCRIAAVERDDMASPVGAPALLHCFGSEGSLILAISFLVVVFVVGFRV